MTKEIRYMTRDNRYGRIICEDEKPVMRLLDDQGFRYAAPKKLDGLRTLKRHKKKK